MAKSEIESLEVSLLLHATEDEERVVDEIRLQLSIRASAIMEVLEGHFGNRIIRVRYHVTRREASGVFAHICSLIPSPEKKKILGEIGRNIDEHKALFLRFSKQELLNGRLALSENDPIRIKVRPSAHAMRGDPSEFYARIMESPSK